MAGSGPAVGVLEPVTFRFKHHNLICLTTAGQKKWMVPRPPQWQNPCTSPSPIRVRRKT